MREFSHIGIPTDRQREGETFLEEGGVHVTDFVSSPYAIEYLRFEPDSPMPEQLKTTAHVAYKVDDLDAALADQEVLIEPFSPMEGLKVAFILHDGVPVELMQEG